MSRNLYIIDKTISSERDVLRVLKENCVLYCSFRSVYAEYTVKSGKSGNLFCG